MMHSRENYEDAMRFGDVDSTAEAVAHNGPGCDSPEFSCGAWRLARWQDFDTHIKAWKASDAWRQRPFRFEDLYGEPEPKEWGPVYPTLPSVEKWRRLNRKRDLTDEETHAYGAAVGEAIRRLNRPAGYAPISLKCTVINTSKGTDNTAEGEEKRYRHWVEVRLPALRAARLGRTTRDEEIDQYLEDAARRHGMDRGQRAWEVEREKIKALAAPAPTLTPIKSNVVRFPRCKQSVQVNKSVNAIKPAPDRSAAAKRAWVTIRANRAAKGLESCGESVAKLRLASTSQNAKPAPDRSAAAKRAWITIRANRAARAAQGN